MTKQAVWECDGCGERFGYTNSLREYPIAVAGNHLWDHLEQFILHACNACQREAGLRSQQEIYHTQSVIRWGVDSPNGEVEAAVAGSGLIRREEMKTNMDRVAEFIEDQLL